MLKYLLLVVTVGCLGVGCNIKNPKEVTPTYIRVDSFNFVDNPKVIKPKLSLSHQITAVAAYYNGVAIGIFDLPVTFPVIATDRGKLMLRPVISMFGLNNFLTSYPFYISDTFSFDAQPGKVISHIPKTHYYDSTKHYLDIDFEIATLPYFTQVDGKVPINTTNNRANVFEGTGSGMISLKVAGDDTLCEIKVAKTFNIPPLTDAYIELNYKCTVPFYLGMRANLDNSASYVQRYLSGVKESDHWQKFYLALKDFAGQYPADNYELFIKASLPAGVESGTVILDNVQLVYF